MIFNILNDPVSALCFDCSQPGSARHGTVQRAEQGERKFKDNSISIMNERFRIIKRRSQRNIMHKQHQKLHFNA